MEGYANLTVAMKPLGDFKTLDEAIAEANNKGLNTERAVIEDLTKDDQRSVKEWLENSN